MNILQDILGLFKRREIIKTPRSNDYFPLATFKSKKEALKPNPKMETVIISAIDLKNYIGGGGGGGEDLAATLLLGNITGGTAISMSAGDNIVATSSDPNKTVTLDFGNLASNRYFDITTDNQNYLTPFLSITNSLAQFGTDTALLEILTNSLDIKKGTFRIKSGAFYYASYIPTTLTADQTYTFQDASGTVAFLSDIAGGSYVQTGQTTDGVQLTLTSSQTITNNSVQSFVTRITAIQSATAGAGTVGDVWVHEFKGVIKQIATVTSLVSTVSDEAIGEDVATAGFSVSIEAGTGVLDIKVTGELNKTIEWKAETIFNEVLI